MASRTWSLASSARSLRRGGAAMGGTRRCLASSAWGFWSSWLGSGASRTCRSLASSAWSLRGGGG
jgi:hypothetical protein